MRNALIRLALVVLVLMPLGCAPGSQAPAREHIRTATQTTHEGLDLWAPCTREQANRLYKWGKRDVHAALEGARCFAVVAEQETDPSRRLLDATRGRELAEAAVEMLPDSGLAHYLAAYLTGLVAENAPLQGLELVPVIERQAQTAARLDPGLDHGGADRLLGELYLRAPGFPVSIGDPQKAVLHYERAMKQDDRYLGNRLGMAIALLANQDPQAACRQMKQILEAMPPEEALQGVWRETLGLMEKLCQAFRRP